MSTLVIYQDTIPVPLTVPTDTRDIFCQNYLKATRNSEKYFHVCWGPKSRTVLAAVRRGRVLKHEIATRWAVEEKLRSLAVHDDLRSHHVSSRSGGAGDR